jgi:hypothetical protein
MKFFWAVLVSCRSSYKCNLIITVYVPYNAKGYIRFLIPKNLPNANILQCGVDIRSSKPSNFRKTNKLRTAGIAYQQRLSGGVPSWVSVKLVVPVP